MSKYYISQLDHNKPKFSTGPMSGYCRPTLVIVSPGFLPISSQNVHQMCPVEVTHAQSHHPDPLVYEQQSNLLPLCSPANKKPNTRSLFSPAQTTLGGEAEKETQRTTNHPPKNNNK